MAKEKTNIAKSSSRGFTLVETAIIVALGSALLVGAGDLVKAWLDEATVMANQQRLITIQQALSHYRTRYARLPCPSSFIAKTTDTALFGREVSPSCLGSTNPNGPADTFSATGRLTAPNPAIIIGALPVRDLGLPDSYRMNTYGFMYTYALTKSEANALDNTAGAIEILDNNSITVLPAAGTAIFTVVDHGKDGKGAYIANSTATAFGSGIPAVPCTAGTGLDVANCNHYASGNFVSAPYSNNAKAPASWFDDTIIYATGMSSNMGFQGCKTIYGTKSALTGTVMQGTSTGHYQYGVDNGSGWAGGCGIFTYQFNNTFTLGNKFASGYNYTSPSSDAYCPDASYNVVSGGCTQVLASPLSPVTSKATFDMNGHITNAYGEDVLYFGTSDTTYPTPFNSVTGKYYQYILPPLSHPAVNNAGVQGWECNGSSAKGMQTQSYALCCPSGE